MLPLFAALLLSAPISATLEDAAFIPGAWVSEEDGVRSEELWTAAAGDGMTGSWRLVAGGRTRVVELLGLRAEDGTLVLRVRHFDGALVAREEKERPLVLRLARKEAGLLRFEGPRVDGGPGDVALTYARSPDGLSVTLEKAGKAQRFELRRVP